MRTAAIAIPVLLAVALLPACGGDPFACERPYLQNVGATGATILYATEEPTTFILEVEGPRGMRAAWASDRDAPRHEARVDGLAPGTRYRFRANVLGPKKPETFEGELVTAPATGDRARLVRFAVLGDSGKTTGGNPFASDGRQAEVAARILEQAPDLVLHTGDVVYDAGAWGEYAEGFFRPFAALIERVPLYPTIGNHDLKTEAGAPYFAAFAPPSSDLGGERHYSFDWGDIHFASLYNPDGRIAFDRRQLEWLDRDLAAAASRRLRVVFGHVPVEGDTWLALRALLVRHRVRLLLAGHVHAYERWKPEDGVHQVVTGGGGRSLIDADDFAERAARPRVAFASRRYHFVLVTVDALRGRVELEAIDEGGAVFDRAEIDLAEGPG